MTVDTKKLREQLQKGLEHIYEMDTRRPADWFATTFAKRLV